VHHQNDAACKLKGWPMTRLRRFAIFALCSVIFWVSLAMAVVFVDRNCLIAFTPVCYDTYSHEVPCAGIDDAFWTRLEAVLNSYSQRHRAFDDGTIGVPIGLALDKSLSGTCQQV